MLLEQDRCPHNRYHCDNVNEADFNAESASPDTREGQSIGAILTVKQKPWYQSDMGPILLTEVGDKVKVLQHFRKDCSTTTLVKVKNLRTGVEGVIGWNAFRAVGARMMCGCKEAKCHCIYEDIYASLEYRERNI